MADKSQGDLDALDVLIAQERALIEYYHARQANAETTAVAAVTAVLALAALTATAAKNAHHLARPWVWIVAGVLALVCVFALAARFIAGLHRSSRGVMKGGLSTRTRELRGSLGKLHEFGIEDPNPLEVRRTVFKVCRDWAVDAETKAEAKELWAAIAMGTLAVAVVLASSAVLLLVRS